MTGLNLYSRLGVSATFDSEHKYVTSPLFRNPVTFAALRATIAVYTLTVLLVTLIWQAVKLDTAQSYFSYFTYLSYIGLCAYYWASGVQTVFYALRWRKAGAGAGYPLQRWPKILQALHIVLQTTIVTYPFLVTIVYWALLSSPTTFATSFSSWSNISVHALNSLWALIEIFLSNSPPAPWFTIIPSILMLAGYLGVAYITKDTQGFYTYSFLDPHTEGPKLAGFIIGIAVGYIIIFSIVRGVVVLRQRWAFKTGRILQAQEDTGSINDDWEEVESPTSVDIRKGGARV
ncbi:hypothetical protein CPB84DRAFT_1816229 [Gymnopilus junonius]|uniref:FAR-17a/AIG1-like protein n=1 Tax=Gymnopilus junonius TaxID=109634 RepID=A0A9P5NHI4_GYMJU|nr:hypothetical protein CPB84DRAFT_1816229 [Gymnopilus junonius]